ncbi:uncharacterized protein LOC129613868 isoform X2 [Condylostylus longicornis]|uniref:uncharacterized protein LOC129613868 isoform X2 n=1 Tax=Condylostylus longicornis TaxID=2530218 RepID=UPI00244DB2CB|nr:uncharacterized protein LOC129613868 isoform X2 [Condylostylus longicornis]XP_055384141.1 uncharacterized protein LOC129613868 isoform X2 [Condylostylus longicornis]XP_055384142.1 uncharacterized protein LOC129613868 isoform X2 [Condylostylus longicornis]XP_055384143.1 uncharacterized protein LOC129613868 isoform X2 [Condylostylus longicornis]
MHRNNIGDKQTAQTAANKNLQTTKNTAVTANRIIVINQIEIKRDITFENREILTNRNLNPIPATISLDNKLIGDSIGSGAIIQCISASNVTSNNNNNNNNNNNGNNSNNNNSNNKSSDITCIKNNKIQFCDDTNSNIETLKDDNTCIRKSTIGTVTIPKTPPTSTILKTVGTTAPSIKINALTTTTTNVTGVLINEDKIISNGREARNRAEKQRRDKLNGSIADLATMVPHVAESPRRVDKTAVLRYSAHGLRLRYVFGKILESKSDEESGTGLLLTDSITKLLDGFLLTVTCRGQIVLITPSVEQHLGHCQTDLFGQNILHITHPDDHQMLKQQLIPTDLDQLFDIQEDENGEPRPRTQEEENEIDRRLLADKRNFTVRLARATPRSEPAAYEIVKIDGCFRRADSAPRGVKSSTFPSGLQLIRRARGRDDSIPLPSISANDIVLVAMVRIIKPPKIIDRLREANNFEYKTRHLIDGRMIMVDQRISLVAGYMTDEVTGLSPFTFMHQDDVRWVIVALRQMYDSNSSYGESCYRLLTRTGRFIYLRTRGYLEIDKNTNQVHSFLCINSLVSEEEGRQRCQEMKNKFSIIINANIPPSNTDGLAVDNPQQLEKAVIYLIENLQKTAREVVEADDDEYCNERGHSNENALDCKTSIHGCDGNESPKNTERLTKSPPLTLVPPNTSSIKSSISKSVAVVNTTAAKSFRISRAKSKCLSEKSNIKDDISSIGEDSNSSNNSSNLNLFANDVAVKEEDQNDKTSFHFNKINHNCGNKNYNSNENISSLNNNGSSSTNKSYNENESNFENQQRKQQNSDINNILIKTENIEYFSDNDNFNENNNRVPPLPKNSGYYEIEIINDPANNSNFGDASKILMTSRTEYKVVQSPSTSLSKYDELNRNREQQKHPDLKRMRNTYEDITLDSCDSPSRKRIALSDSPLGIENVSTSSLDNDQMFMNATTAMQRTSNPQEDLSQLLPSSFSQIKNSLSHIKTATTELKRQCIAYADTQNQLEEIIDERDKQEELLENIQNEYEAHLLEHQGLVTSPISTSDGSISLSLSNVLKSSECKSSTTTAAKTNTVIDFDTDDILQRNINLTNTR